MTTRSYGKVSRRSSPETDIALVDEAADGREAVEQFRRLSPDCPRRGRGSGLLSLFLNR